MNQLPVRLVSRSTRCPALSSTVFLFCPEVTYLSRPELGSGMNFNVPLAAGEKPLCGMTPPGKTQFSVLVQFDRLYGSSAVTVYPSRFESTLAQYDPFTTIGLPSLSVN